MKTNAKMMVIGLVLVMVFCYSGSTLADEGIGTDTAAAHLNFEVTIADYILFQVGSSGSIDTIIFQPDTSDIITPTTINGTGGDLTGGRVTVRLLSNSSSVAITETNDGGGSGLVGSVSGNISYASILTADDNGGTGGTGITPPQLTDAGGNVTPTMSGAQNINTSWTYTYRHNGDQPTAGSYTGQVTYTAAIP
ncbi:MAG: hypothetical protein JRD49_10725 [Deltaproteobacteria bacterium]|nr:hypothetical protein [Deltaproteobacteria bacterium]MBW2678029.1 hypothetical protein [Deltaproteobacteria bacterium]